MITNSFSFLIFILYLFKDSLNVLRHIIVSYIALVHTCEKIHKTKLVKIFNKLLHSQNSTLLNHLLIESWTLIFVYIMSSSVLSRAFIKECFTIFPWIFFQNAHSYSVSFDAGAFLILPEVYHWIIFGQQTRFVFLPQMVLNMNYEIWRVQFS